MANSEVCVLSGFFVDRGTSNKDIYYSNICVKYGVQRAIKVAIESLQQKDEDSDLENIFIEVYKDEFKICTIDIDTYNNLESYRNQINTDFNIQ